MFLGDTPLLYGDAFAKRRKKLSFFHAGRRREIHRLIGIVRRRVVAVGEPLLELLFFHRSGVKAHPHRKRRHALLVDIHLALAG